MGSVNVRIHIARRALLLYVAGPSSARDAPGPSVLSPPTSLLDEAIRRRAKLEQEDKERDRYEDNPWNVRPTPH